MNRNRDALIIAVLVAAFASFAGCATEPEVAGDRGAPAPLVEAHERVEAGSQKNARGRADHDGDGDDQSRSRDDDHGDGGRGEHHDDDDHQGNEEGGHDHHDHDGDEDCDSPALEVQVDPSLSPEVEDYVEPDGLSFRHARITYDDGANDFISNQLVLYDVSTRDLRQVLRRWRGRVVREIAAGRPEPDGYLVEVDPSTAHPEHFARDLERILGERPTGTLTFSSDEALATVVIAAAEAAEGRTVGVNVVMRPAGLDNARVTEGPMGAPLAPGSGALYSPNPFNWVNFSATLGAHHGVPQAWQFLAQNGLIQRIAVAVLDQGFVESADLTTFNALWTFGRNPWGVPNTDVCTGGSGCPWHGTWVANTLGGRPDNDFGSAGTGGPVAGSMVLIFERYNQYSAMHGMNEAHRNGARIVNMSWGGSTSWIFQWWVNPLDHAARGAYERDGMLVFASAGNDGENVDQHAREGRPHPGRETRFYYPCESRRVICVGGLATGTESPDSNSNLGREDINMWAPYANWSAAVPGVAAPGHEANAFPVFGTSFSSPYVAGVAALVWAVDPAMSNEAVLDCLYGSARLSPDPDVSRVVDALAAVRCAYARRGTGLPPTITITAPTEEDQVFPQIPGVVFLARAFDPEEGVLSGSIVWSSDVDGPLGTGSIILAALSPGLHTVTAAVTDADGNYVETTLRVVIDGPPQVSITSPAPGATFAYGDTIALRAEAVDVVDGPLPGSSIAWSSSLDGALGSGAGLQVLLTPGTHLITATATDSAGLTATDSLTLVVDPPSASSAPVVRIFQPTEGAFVVQGSNVVSPGVVETMVRFRADAVDPEDGVLDGASVIWRVTTAIQANDVVGVGRTISGSVLTPLADCLAPEPVEATVTATDSDFNVVVQTVRFVSGPICPL